MLDWKGEDLSPNQDGSIDRTILEASDKKRSPSDGAFVKGKVNHHFVVCYNLMWFPEYTHSSHFWHFRGPRV